VAQSRVELPAWRILNTSRLVTRGFAAKKAL
jgi:hypothetical protein